MEKGINPDVEIELSVDDFSKNKDPQMDKAMEVIREEIKARLNN
jgi:C-terminal processing protease CtpA/Prc